MVMSAGRGATLSARGEESAGRRPVLVFRHEHVDDLAGLVDHPVEGSPPAIDLDVCLIDEPAVPLGVSARPG